MSESEIIEPKKTRRTPAKTTNGGIEPAQPVSETAALMEVISRAASDPAADIDKMERLMAMHERLQTTDAQRAFNAALAQAKAEMPVVVATSYNDQTRKKYADLKDIAKTVDPIISKHGFALSFKQFPAKLEGHFGLCGILRHKDGHTEEYPHEFPLEDGKGFEKKSNLWKHGSTNTYARRYIKADIFDISVEDDDGQRASFEPISEDRLDELLALADKHEIDKKAFCEFFNIESFADISEQNFSAAKAAILKKAKANETAK